MHLTKKATAAMLIAGACVAGTSGAAFATPERAELPGVVSIGAGDVPVATAAAGSLCVYQARDTRRDGTVSAPVTTTCATTAVTSAPRR
ncbi:hypothetical protein E1295_34815 [Nonomuraea mesophila]|uniref:Uncharacterized protein n=1 Tax=Nonomuraea mesophila TaxID=2530382 RepID=A0A4R5EPZ2_9ACTN|nr:hypothetical protein [Nonomuraea mesophila]TDE36865.1 hypothetical protein E1295_34815 [Nonomuraea mesophila]